MRHFVIIALGTNIRQNAHIQWASQKLSFLLSDYQQSRVIWTADIKHSDKMYMNRLVCGYTQLSVDDLQHTLKQIETESGRTRHDVTIDLDLMQYDQQRYHERDWERPYIQNIIDDIL